MRRVENKTKDNLHVLDIYHTNLLTELSILSVSKHLEPVVRIISLKANHTQPLFVNINMSIILNDVKCKIDIDDYVRQLNC